MISVLLIIMQAGCMSIAHGTTQDVVVLTDPSDAMIEYHGQEFKPGPINLERGNNHRLYIKKDGYEEQTLLISRNISGWLWVETVLLLIGGLIDGLNGAGFNLSPVSTTVRLQKISN